ncbi:hypothetical protein HAX54_035646 [Datura stramonium]|uniref:Uncharacterized protein n=1 Tax=Datura stramonium TaxID=4076 RepID=A0ABS8SFL1_DATST|nr:hypothetical protein [Datura stramonium]
MPASWEPKVTAIKEAKQMSTMQMDELIGNLQTYELKKIDKVAEESKKERNISLEQLASKAFKKAMKSLRGETSDEESEGEEAENDNLALMVRSDSDSNEESSKAEVRGSNKNGILTVVAPST